MPIYIYKDMTIYLHREKINDLVAKRQYKGGLELVGYIKKPSMVAKKWWLEFWLCSCVIECKGTSGSWWV